MLKSGVYVMMGYDYNDIRNRVFDLMKRKTIVYQETFEIIKEGAV
jgi:hypothetical protein